MIQSNSMLNKFHENRYKLSELLQSIDENKINNVNSFFYTSKSNDQELIHKITQNIHLPYRHVN